MIKNFLIFKKEKRPSTYCIRIMKNINVEKNILNQTQSSEI